MKNKIFIKRKSKVIVKEGQENLDPNYILNFVGNIEQLGYAITEKLAVRLSTLNVEEFCIFYDEILSYLKEITGSSIKYKPMYPNFPAQVSEIPLEKLFEINSLHYLGDWIGIRIIPDFEIKKRNILNEITKIKVIDLGTEEEFEEIFRNILASKSTFSQQDRIDLGWCIRNYAYQINSYLPEDLPNKENMATIISMLIKHTQNSENFYSNYINTATDILRLASAMSDGDVSLADNTIFRSYKRIERRFLLSLLEHCVLPVEDMIRNKNRWIRLGEKLHPGEYKTRYPKAAESFDIIRNNRPYETFNRLLEKYLSANDFIKAAQHLEQRPGEFSRRLDHLLRTSENKQEILSKFESLSNKVSTNVLLQLYAHFQYRDIENDLRIFFPKGNVARAFARKNNIKTIDKEVCLKVVDTIQNTLIHRFKEREALGKVYIDPLLKNYTVPLSQRSASKSLKTISRGSRIELPVGNTIRFFLWWKEGVVNNTPTGRIDVDLSAVLYNKNWDYQEHISFTKLKSSQCNAYHSGDITSAPDGASEFIDIDISAALDIGCRYIVMSLNCFTNHLYCNIPECYAGWMMRQNPNSGEIYEPKTVDQRIDIAAESSIAIPVIIDLDSRQIIWTDLALSQNPYWYNTIEGNQKGMVLIGQAMADLHKPNLYDLYTMHALARGVLTDDKKQADTIFALDNGITPFDTDVINAKFL